MKCYRIAPALALVLASSACQDTSVQPLAPGQTQEMEAAQLVVEEGLVSTPSGALFTQEEWAGIEQKGPYLEPAEQIAARVMKEQESRKLRNGMQFSVTGNAAPHILCHSNAGICAQIKQLIPGTTITYWSDSQWSTATAAQFAAFDLIYIQDAGSRQPGIVASKDTWGVATTGRVALTGVHFEHCNAVDQTSGPCRVLKASVKWIHEGQGTGLLMATQSDGNGQVVLPTVAPYNGVTFYRSGGGWDRVRITDPGHATMQGSTDASLSNFRQSSHSIFGEIGGFTSVAEICDLQVLYPSACTGTYRPHYLVTSVGVADQDGDGVPDATDNCPTVGNASQADANGNNVGDACESAPSVTITPSAASVPVGGTVQFIATAQDTDHSLPQLTFEWRVDGIVQQGATTATFTGTFAADATVRVTVRDPGLLSGFAEAAVTVQTDATPPVITPTVTGTAGANGWYTSDVDISWTVVDGESAVSTPTGCGPASVTADTDGVAYTCTASSAGGTASQTVTVKRDATTPTVSSDVTGTLGDNGWYVSDVSISWSVSDATSGIASQVQCEPASVTGDTGSASFTCTATDNAGLSASADVTVKRDATPPTVAATVVGTLGNNGWYVSDVNVSWNVTDATSGVAAQAGCDASDVTADTGSASFTCTATDAAGLSASADVTVKRDATAPHVAYSGSMSTYTVDQAVAISCTAGDALSGLASNSCADIAGDAYLFNLGVNTFSASAEDNAGNTGSASVSFTVTVTTQSLCTLTERFVTRTGVSNSLCAKLRAAGQSAARGQTNAQRGQLEAYINEIAAQAGNSVSAAHAAILTQLARALM